MSILYFMIGRMFSLVLGGGGARGYIHLGVYKYLIEHNMIPNDIVGTSMGAIIGTMIALGRSYDRIYEEIKRFAVYKVLGFPSSRGILPEKKIKAYAQELFGKIHIEDSKIPLGIVSYNISTGQSTVFRQGLLTGALSASIAIPGIFPPYKIENSLFLDGGIGNNLPCEEGKTDNIIAVSTMNSNANLDENSSVMMLCIKSLSQLIRQNEDFSILKAEKIHNKNIQLLRPDLSGYEVYSFDNYDELIEIGYTCAKTILGDPTHIS